MHYTPTKNYILTPEDFLSRPERTQLLATCRRLAAEDLLAGRTTWVTRYALVDLALYSGLRVGEMAALEHRDLILSDPDPYIIVRHGKGNRERVVYIDTALATHLTEYAEYKSHTLALAVDPDSPVFAGQAGQHSPAITLQKSFKQAVTAAGLRPGLSIHKCRHTYATYLLHDTGNLRYVQRQLGHAHISMTSLYADILPEANGTLANKIRRDE